MVIISYLHLYQSYGLIVVIRWVLDLLSCLFDYLPLFAAVVVCVSEIT